MSVNINIAIPLETILNIQRAINVDGNLDADASISTQTTRAVVNAVKTLPHPIMSDAGQRSLPLSTPAFPPVGSATIDPTTAARIAKQVLNTDGFITNPYLRLRGLSYEQLLVHCLKNGFQREQKRTQTLALQLDSLIQAVDLHHPEILNTDGMPKTSLTFTVKRLSGKVSKMTMRRTETLSDFASAIQVREGIQPCRIRLIHKGAVLFEGKNVRHEAEDSGMYQRTIVEVS